MMEVTADMATKEVTVVMGERVDTVRCHICSCYLRDLHFYQFLNYVFDLDLGGWGWSGWKGWGH